MAVAIPVVVLLLPGMFPDDRPTALVSRARGCRICDMMHMGVRIVVRVSIVIVVVVAVAVLFVASVMVMVVITVRLGLVTVSTCWRALSDESIPSRERTCTRLGEHIARNDLRVLKQQALIELCEWKGRIVVLAQPGNRGGEFLHELDDACFKRGQQFVVSTWVRVHIPRLCPNEAPFH